MLRAGPPCRQTPKSRAREFPARPIVWHVCGAPPLKEIAAASGLSISGVRIAYDEDEMREVIAITGDKPSRPLPEPEA